MKKTLTVIICLFSLTSFAQTISHSCYVKKKHFVRFMFFSSIYPLVGSFSLSLETLSPPNSNNEPESYGQILDEHNIIVDKNIYSIFKNYIIIRKLGTNSKIRQHFNFTMAIDVDYKYRYYLNHKQAIDFLTNMIAYLKSQNISDRYWNNLSMIIERAKYALSQEGKQPVDPN